MLVKDSINLGQVLFVDCTCSIISKTNGPCLDLLFGLWSSHSRETVTKSEGAVTDHLQKHLLFGGWISPVQQLPSP